MSAVVGSVARAGDSCQSASGQTPRHGQIDHGGSVSYESERCIFKMTTETCTVEGGFESSSSQGSMQEGSGSSVPSIPSTTAATPSMTGEVRQPKTKEELMQLMEETDEEMRRTKELFMEYREASHGVATPRRASHDSNEHDTAKLAAPHMNQTRVESEQTHNDLDVTTKMALPSPVPA